MTEGVRRAVAMTGSDELQRRSQAALAFAAAHRGAAERIATQLAALLGDRLGAGP
jgi:hypothetical protein